MLGGPDRKIVVDGKTWRFEMHPYCGPMLLREDGEPRKSQFGYATKKFWDAVTFWAQQGERVDANSICLWDAPEELEWEWRGRKKFVIPKQLPPMPPRNP